MTATTWTPPVSQDLITAPENEIYSIELLIDIFMTALHVIIYK